MQILFQENVANVFMARTALTHLSILNMGQTP